MGGARKGLPLGAGRERDRRRIRRHKHPCDLECSWGRSWGKGVVWFSTTVELIPPLWRKPARIKARRHGESAPWRARKLRRQLAGVVQRTAGAIYLDVCAMVGTNYILCSVGPKPKQNKTNKNPPQIPEKQQEGMQEVLTGHTDPGGVVNAARAFNAHPTVSPMPGSPIRLVRLLTDGDLGTRPSRSLPLCDFPSLPCLLQG